MKDRKDMKEMKDMKRIRTRHVRTRFVEKRPPFMTFIRFMSFMHGGSRG